MAQKRCDLCQWYADEELDVEYQWTQHLCSPWHRVNFLKHFYSKHRKQLLCCKKDIEISCLEVVTNDFKVCGSARPTSTCTFTLAIVNKGQSVFFVACEFLHKLACRCSTSDDMGVARGEKVLEIPEGCSDPYYVKVEVTPDHIGIYQSPLIFQFRRGTVPFYIGLEIVVSCSDEIVWSLEDSKPYTRKTENDVLPFGATIYPGIKPKGGPKVFYKNPLPDFKINDELRRAIEKLQDFFKSWVHVPKESRDLGRLKEDQRAIYDFLEDTLNENNYRMYCNLLLNLEEVQMDHDIRKYDMRNVDMSRSKMNSSLLSLRVLGLAEKRPSVLKGDRLYVRIVKEKEDVEYCGIVHFIQETYVLLGFGKELMAKYLPNMKFNVRFVCNKFPMKVMMRGLESVSAEHVKYWLFPKEECAAKCAPAISPTERLIFYNRNIEENPEQRTAIQHIVAGSSLPAPYLLHGPPGTGKTVTLVEAVMQIWKIYKVEPHRAVVLVCTPSNSASDLITERLLQKIPRNEVFRFYSMSRNLTDVPKEIQEKKCFNYDFDKNTFFVPKTKVLEQYRIIVSTLCNSSRLVSLGFEIGHFTHVFLDESGHAEEPEAIIPLTGLVRCRQEHDDDFGGQIVLAGDPKQLGPVIRCRLAQEFRLDISLLERLMETDIYLKSKEEGDDGPGRFNPKLLTRLRNNYRSHGAILTLPNNLFYEGELRVCADELLRNSLCHWEGLPNNKFPVLFHGVLGRDMQEAKNPSYFNPQEVSVVVHYVHWLLNSRKGGINIKPKDIGVISPYRQQVYKIRNELKKKNRGDLTVGSVDEFQGQERKVIIISTVRSDPDLMNYDRKYKLGFLDNPKRFNVALTRAQCLLIVIGNPNLLSKDVHWNQFLRYCRDNGSYVGANYDDPDEEISDILQRFKSLHLVPVEQEPVRISHRANQEDPEWRNDF